MNTHQPPSEQAANPGPPLQAKLAFLGRPESHAPRPAAVEVIETHMSWVFLTESLVYKLKKPVRYDFLDFGTLEARHRDCREEVRLNRRLAPDVYLGVVPLTEDDDGRLALDGEGTVVEWLVKMRRLPAHCMLDRRIRAGTVDEEDVRRFTLRLARFYREAPPVEMAPDAYLERLRRDVLFNHRQLLDHDYRLDTAQLDRITSAQLGIVVDSPELFTRRVEARRIVEGHGDLRPEHVCLEDGPLFIDCLEFKREFRIVDPVDELADLAMECEIAGAAFIGPLMFETYARETGDDPPQRLIHFHTACRATLRARLAIWHLKDHEADQHSRWVRRTRAYLDCAEAYGALL